MVIIGYILYMRFGKQKNKKRKEAGIKVVENVL